MECRSSLALFGCSAIREVGSCEVSEGCGQKHLCAWTFGQHCLWRFVFLMSELAEETFLSIYTCGVAWFFDNINMRFCYFTPVMVQSLDVSLTLAWSRLAVLSSIPGLEHIQYVYRKVSAIQITQAQLCKVLAGSLLISEATNVKNICLKFFIR